MGAYSRLVANSRLGAYSNKYGKSFPQYRRFFFFAFFRQANGKGQSEREAPDMKARRGKVSRAPRPLRNSFARKTKKKHLFCLLHGRLYCMVYSTDI